jgi:hypothetical protein
VVVHLHDLGPVERRLSEPALPVSADPDGVGQRTQAVERLLRGRARRSVVATEEVSIGTDRGRCPEYFVERRGISVNVVQDR